MANIDPVKARNDMIDRFVLLELAGGPVDVGSACMRAERQHGLTWQDTARSVERLVADGTVRRFNRTDNWGTWDMIEIASARREAARTPAPDLSALLCSTFRDAITGALRGPLATTQGTPASVVAALLAVTAELSRVAGVDFTHMACSMVATVEPDREKAVGALIASYAPKDGGQ